MLDSLDKFAISPALMVAAMALPLGGCLEDAPLPRLGECAVVPDDVGGYALADGTSTYEYGQVGVGTCLASPTDMRVVADPADPDNHYLLVLNANARTNFEGSSLLSIDTSSIDLTCPVNGLHELSSSALGMQEFAARMDFDEDTGIGLVTARVFGGENGTLNDVVYTVDATDPSALAYHDAGPHGFGPYRFVSVPADPWSVRVNPWNRTAYVLSLTEHTINGIDLSTDPVSFMDLTPEFEFIEGPIQDLDGSGSAPDMTVLGFDSVLLQSETLSLEWQEGVTRLYYPAVDDDGLRSLFFADSADGRTFHELSGGPVLEPGAGWTQGGFGSVWLDLVDDSGAAGFVTAQDADGSWGVGWMESTESAVEWQLDADALVTPIADWEGSRIADPWALTDDDGLFHLYYSGGDGLGSAIGHAEGGTPALVAVTGDPSLTDGEHGVVFAPAASGFDSAAVFSPSVLRLGADWPWFLYYAGHADTAVAAGEVPDGLAIGLALSQDAGADFDRHTYGLDGGAQVLAAGPAGAWDSGGVAAPSVVAEGDRVYLYYQGWDGTQWQLGRAYSIDGFTFEKDPANPIGPGIVDAAGLPVRTFAWRPWSGGYYRFEGTISGAFSDVVFENGVFEPPASPVKLELVGGQALGRGGSGELHQDGVSSAASAALREPALVVAHSGTRRRLLVADPVGAGLRPRAAVQLAGFTGDLSDLNGADPDRRILGVDVVNLDVGVLAALELDVGIALVSGDLSGDSPVLTAVTGGIALQPRGGALFDASRVSNPSLSVDGPDGLWRLYYQGENVDRTAVGRATSDDAGVTWTVPDEPAFQRGAAGTWNDDSVGHPSVRYDAEAARWQLWFRGSDGGLVTIGYAESTDEATWYADIAEATPAAPIWDGADVPFADSVLDPQVRWGDGVYQMWFDAVLESTLEVEHTRVGRAWSLDGIHWQPLTNPTTHGDRIDLVTRQGDEDPAGGIFLGDGSRDNVVVDDVLVSGAGASEMVLSPDGRWAVVANKRDSFLIVLDLFDDSTDTYLDANYNGVEAAIFVAQARGMVGMRAMQFSEDGQTLWVTLSPLTIPTASGSLNDGTEGVITIDFSRIVDGPEGQSWLDGIITGFLPVARGIEEDRGYETDTSVGPGGLAVNRAGTRAYVTNFNDNSLYVLDVERGARGAVIDIIRGLDEMPFEVALSPDERVAYIGNSYGIQRDGAQHSTIQVVDIDEASPTYGEVLTRLSNLGTRSGCGAN
jgi:hypothetical protein